ncbi:VCBS repeat-containing protein [Bradyrhizobium sp. USDA 4011]
MSVASGVEFGGVCVAALGQPPRLIGNIETAIGCGTIRRASGIAVRGAIGDPVREGEVIEVAAGGRIEIRLIDGGVLDLPGGTCLELNGCAQDPSDIAQPGLLAKTRGIFRSIGSWLARSDTLTAAPSVGNIRAGGFGTLSLTALTFSLLNDARAAEPNVTFLDDDSITYKDLHHGVFELVTKEAIPRHIVVDDPGVTIILSAKGSSVGVNQVTNSPAHMEELREAQQEALANFEKGAGSKGSGMPASEGSPLLQPINFQPGAPPLTQDPLAPVPEVIFATIQTFKPPPVPPSLNLGAGLAEIDTAKFDDFNAASGTFSASSKNGAVTFGIGGGTAGNVVLGQLTYNVSSTGQFGTLYLNSETGNYTFVPNNAAINALKVNSSQDFVITVSDGTLSTSESFNITIVGVDDASIISGAKAGAVVGAVGVSGASPGLLVASGTLTDTDVDDPANTFTAVNVPTTSAGGHGTFTLTTAGVWTYTLNNADSSVQALHVGDTLTDSFTVTTIGGTPQVVTITIHGPLIEARPAPSLTLSETHLTATALDDNIAGSAPDAALTTTSGEFSAAFVTEAGLAVSYALTITGGNGAASGLIDSHTGLSDVLVLNGNTIEGHVGTASGTLAFTITVDPATGRVTFVEHRAVEQPLGTSPDSGEAIALGAGIVNLIATVTNSDGQYQDVSIDLGKQLTITDDGPSIKANATAPSLTLSETHLTATALDDHIAGSAPCAALTTISADFSTAFTSVQGADGATTHYALAINGGNGTASGLIDSHTGCADVLVQHGNTVEGHVGTASGELAFTIALDPATGSVTFTEYRAVTHPPCTSADEAVSLTAGIVNLVATITDKDGDTQSASIDLGKQLTITDDHPTICGFPETFVAAQDNQTATGTYHVDFGADGDAAMLVAVHNGAVGCTGYDLATSCLGDGITSVHVTGHGDDYSFYYTTHEVGGGVELDAYLRDCGGTLADPYFKLLIDPDGTFCFDLEHAGPSRDVTVTGSDFDAPACGTPSLTAPDGQLVITGSDCAGHPLDVRASECGIAVGDSGLQMDPTEQLNLAFSGKQSQVSFDLTQWQAYGTAGVILKVLDGSADVHDFCIDVPKPLCGSASFVVQETSDASLIDSYTFDATTTTYTLYVDKAFNQVQVDYDRPEAGHPTFAVNHINYTEKTSINTDLLFNVTAVDGDGDSATTNLQVDIQCHTAGMDAFTFAPSPDNAAVPSVSSSTSAPAPDVSATSTSSHEDAAWSQAVVPFAGGGTSGTTGQSFQFAEQLPSLEQQGASAPPQFDQTATWFGHHQDSAGFSLAQGAADGPPATGPAIPEHQPDYFSVHMPDAVVTNTPHDLIV